MWPDPQFPADLVTFTEEILMENFIFVQWYIIWKLDNWLSFKTEFQVVLCYCYCLLMFRMMLWYWFRVWGNFLTLPILLKFSTLCDFNYFSPLVLATTLQQPWEKKLKIENHGKKVWVSSVSEFCMFLKTFIIQNFCINIAKMFEIFIKQIYAKTFKFCQLFHF